MARTQPRSQRGQGPRCLVPPWASPPLPPPPPPSPEDAGQYWAVTSKVPGGPGDGHSSRSLLLSPEDWLPGKQLAKTISPSIPHPPPKPVHTEAFTWRTPLPLLLPPYTHQNLQGGQIGGTGGPCPLARGAATCCLWQQRPCREGSGGRHTLWSAPCLQGHPWALPPPLLFPPAPLLTPPIYPSFR